MTDVENKDGLNSRTSNAHVHDRLMVAQATAGETQMSLLEGIKLYPKAIGFSAIVSACIIMEGYDKNLLQGLFAFAPFQRRYGQPQGNGKFELTAPWQSGLANGTAVGEILGLFINGWASERYGYRKTLLVSLFAVTGFIFITFFAPSIQVLLVGQILCGIPWGVFQTLTTVYASEVLPVNLRAYLTTYVNLCWVIGTLLGQGILRAFVNSGDDQWAYRIPFAIQWVWPVPIAIGVFFAPESPWWLTRQGRSTSAKKALKRLQSRHGSTEDELDATVAMMAHTNQFEKDTEVGSSYSACFKGVDLRRTEITCMVWAIQNLSGAGFMGYSTYFFQQAGLSIDNSFNIAMGQYAIGAVGTILSWFLMAKFGRRTLYLAGLTGQCVVLMIIGFLGLTPGSNSTAPWVVGGMMIAYTFIYDMTVGPVCYALVPEVPAGRLRTRTVVLARNLYNVINIVMNIIIPRMLNPTAWNWKAKSGFFYGGLAFFCLIWSFFRLPETKGRTYGELGILFEKRVAARKFRSTVVDVYSEDAQAEDSPKPAVERIEVTS